jgi:tetratricopeptide (TPR) repeat protein
MMQKARARSFEASSVDGLSDDTNKRVRESCASVEAIQLNANGIANLQRGQDMEAENCFSLALYLLERQQSKGQKRDNDEENVEVETLSQASSALVMQLECSSSSLDYNSATDGKSDVLSASPSKQRCSYIYQRHGYDEGMDVYRDALILSDGLDESIRSATLHYNVGQTKMRRGKYEAARQSFQLAYDHLIDVHPLQEQESNRIVFTRSELIIQIHHNIGSCLYRGGMIESALQSFQKSLDEAQRVPDASYSAKAIAYAQNAYGVALFHAESCQGKSECMELFTKILPVYKILFGANSKEVATVYNNIGRVYYVQSLLEDALVAYKEALNIRRTVLGPKSIDLAATICNTGQAYHQLAKYETALEYYTEFIQLAKERFGKNHHRDVAITLRFIAEVYHEQNLFQDAKKLYENALEVGRNAVGNIHPEVAATLNKLGNLHFEQNEFDIALKYYQEGYAIEQQVLDAFHPHRITTLSNIAQIYRRQGNYSTALLTYVEIHRLQVKVYGSNTIEVANTLSNMGFMQFHLHAYKSSFDLYQETLRIQHHNYASSENTANYNEIAATLSSMGLVSFNMGSFRIALDCFHESLRIRQKILETDNKDLAILWYNIATIYLEQGDDDDAIRFYKEALRVERKALGENPHDVIMTLQHIGLVYQRRGDLDEALKYFNEALSLQVEKCEDDSIPAARLLNLVGNINLQQGDTEKMMECYTMASRIYNKYQGQPDSMLVIAGHSFYGLSKLHPPCAPVA